MPVIIDQQGFPVIPAIQQPWERAAKPAPRVIFPGGPPPAPPDYSPPPQNNYPADGGPGNIPGNSQYEDAIARWYRQRGQTPPPRFIPGDPQSEEAIARWNSAPPGAFSMPMAPNIPPEMMQGLAASIGRRR